MTIPRRSPGDPCVFPAIVHLKTTESTMQEAARLADDGAAHGTCFVAEEQTAGVGRHGHQWRSEKSAGLYATVILRPELTPSELPMVTLALGLAVAHAIEDVTAIRCDLRWPNDVMIADRKVAGILTSVHGEALLAGIGINVNQRIFPPELAGIAISLRMAGSRDYSVERMLHATLPRVQEMVALLCYEGRDSILRRFEQVSSYARGRRVTVEGRQGVTEGLDDNGFLLLRNDDGTRTTILAGGVRPA